MKKDEESAGSDGGGGADVPLAERACAACRDAKEPLAPEQAAALLWHLDGWEVADGRRLRRRFKFKDFARALAFVDAVGALAEREGHHPQILFGWGFVTVDVWTHRVDGLTEADFVLAAKVDRLPRG